MKIVNTGNVLSHTLNLNIDAIKLCGLKITVQGLGVYRKYPKTRNSTKNTLSIFKN
jgi:hypothetical protein